MAATVRRSASGTASRASIPERTGAAFAFKADGHLNAIGGIVQEVREWIKAAKPPQKLTPQEKAKGRSEGYYEMSPEDQWAEDKRLGILDWDGS